MFESRQTPVRIDLRETDGFVSAELHWEKFDPTEADSLPTSQGEVRREVMGLSAPGAGQLFSRGEPERWRRALMGGSVAVWED